MAWTSLSTRLNTLPLVIAGPILRRVEKNSVTVWIALRAEASVQLKIWDIGGTLKATSGVEKTIPLGINLHVLAITVAPTNPLATDTLYKYDLFFSGFSAAGINISSGQLTTAKIIDNSGSTASIAYKSKGYDLPTFCLPPSDINNLRILHGSCRKPHGQGFDALWVADELINSSATEPKKRPQQLVLTGDQIYADDVNDLMLFLICDAQKALLGWTEDFSSFISSNADLLPGKRADLITKKAQFTVEGKHAGSHLMKLGEFYCMYLFCWSNTLWPATQQDFPDIAGNNLSRWTQVFGASLGLTWDAKSKEKYFDPVVNPDSESNKYLSEFYKNMWKVRRMFANISTYMVFDDHDVTDDWNFNKQWCLNVYGSMLGKRIVTNAVAAFAIFQNWGNNPDQFKKISGTNVINELKKQDQINYVTLQTYLNVNTPTTLSKEMIQQRAFLVWDFSISWDNHQIIALDTRTTRAWPPTSKKPNGEENGFPELISDSALNDQTQNWNQAVKVTVVIVPSPVFGVDRIDSAAKLPASVGVNPTWKDNEFWSLQPLSKERLLAKVAKKSSSNGVERTGRIILLSGDVHYSFAERCEYWASKPLTSNTIDRSHLVIVQLNASSFKNEDSSKLGTKNAHNLGYKMFSGVPPSVYKLWGYNNLLLQQKKVGYTLSFPSMDFHAIIHPILLSSNDVHIKITETPDWVYIVNYLLHECPQKNEIREKDILGTLHKSSLQEAGFGAKNLNTYFYINHGKDNAVWGAGKEIVGRNNLGEIYFEWGPNESDKFVNQWLWWHLPETKIRIVYKDLPVTSGNIVDVKKSIPAPLTQYRVSLGLSHPTAANTPKYPIPEPKPTGF